jgi:BA14K-like protein
MLSTAGKLAATIVLATSMCSFANVASAAPMTGALALKNAAPVNVESVQWRRRGYGWGGVAAGFAAGAIIGGALAAPYYYGPGPYYYAPPPPPPPVYYGGPTAAPAAGDAVAYCMQRFKSYDPQSGTYLGFDGQRHPCP